MPSPFPGMDPYLEHPAHWLDIHNRFITYLSDDLNERLGGRYYASASERVVIEGARGIYPDVAIVRSADPPAAPAVVTIGRPAPIRVRAGAAEYREAFVEIRAFDGERVVTVVELLSPANKRRRSEGRTLYRKKQREVLSSGASLVEIDLLRRGAWTVAVPELVARAERPFDYIVSVSRPADREEFDIYPIALPDPLPPIAIPLEAGEPDALADLRSLLDRCYDRGIYGRKIDYRKEPFPPLSGSSAAWADGLLRGAGRR